MEKLTDIKWEELNDAYGQATDIPALLNQLSIDPSPKTSTKDEPWFSLWSRLCHQGDTYSASYVAVPYISQIALNNIEMSIDMNFFLLPACIEISRKTNQIVLNEELLHDYENAIKQLSKLAENYLESTDTNLSKAAQIIQIVSSGKIEEANRILSEL